VRETAPGRKPPSKRVALAQPRLCKIEDVPKTRTLDQIVAMKEKAARFVRDVVATRSAPMSSSHVARGVCYGKRIEIRNPSSGNTKRTIRRLYMPRPTYAILKTASTNWKRRTKPHDKLDSVLDIVSERTKTRRRRQD